MQTSRTPIYDARDLNFQLKPAGKAVDAGIRMPNVNDDYTGKAPDLGAYELAGRFRRTGLDEYRGAVYFPRSTLALRSRRCGSPPARFASLLC